RPALIAIFAEHAGEHDVTSVGMGITKYLLENYGKDARVTKLLNEKEVYIVPMMNPDGIEYDLSAEAKPFTWRKNRKPVRETAFGVDLNRNWGYKWDVVPEELKKQYYDPNDDYYHGEGPFSENETKALRDFLSGHKNIKIFMDYHSGSAPFYLKPFIGFFLPKSTVAPGGSADWVYGELGIM
ncbi:MAG: hypothetical protein HZC12_03665, partial [Nitrospirae bacterium]|nr:hypothetical protein [Nitrospirota bacterium]